MGPWSRPHVPYPIYSCPHGLVTQRTCVCRQDAPLQGFRAVWPVLQVLLLGAASWAFHFSKRGQQQNQQPPQRTQHKDHQAVAEAPSYCCCLSLPRSSSEKWASAAEQHDDHAAGSSCAAGASGRQQSSSSIGSWPAGEAAAAAGRETPATAGHAKASSGCSPAASCQTTAGAGAGAATSAEWLLSQPWLAQTQQPQPQPQQHLQTQVKWPAAASTAATSAGGGSSVAALQALRQQLLQGRAAEYAALLLQAPPPPYRSRTRPTTQFAKIRGMELEEVAQDWQKRLQEHLDKQGLMLTGAYIRRGWYARVVRAGVRACGGRRSERTSQYGRRAIFVASEGRVARQRRWPLSPSIHRRALAGMAS